MNDGVRVLLFADPEKLAEGGNYNMSGTTG